MGGRKKDSCIDDSVLSGAESRNPRQEKEDIHIHTTPTTATTQSVTIMSQGGQGYREKPIFRFRARGRSLKKSCIKMSLTLPYHGETVLVLSTHTSSTVLGRVRYENRGGIHMRCRYKGIIESWKDTHIVRLPLSSAVYPKQKIQQSVSGKKKNP